MPDIIKVETEFSCGHSSHEALRGREFEVWAANLKGRTCQCGHGKSVLTRIDARQAARQAA